MPSTSAHQSSNGYFPDTQNIISFILSTLDRIASPQSRQKAYNTVFRFCYQRPVLSSFLGAQLLFAFVPVLCFIGFSISVILFVSALALGLSLFWVLVAGVVLFWALVLTFTLAAGTWLYLAFCFIAIRRIGKATGYIETPQDRRGRSVTKPAGSGSNTQNGTDVKQEEKETKIYYWNDEKEREKEKEKPKAEGKLNGELNDLTANETPLGDTKPPV